MIIPNLSYFRTLYDYKTKLKLNNLKNILKKKEIKKFFNYLYESRKGNLEQQFLFSINEKKKFCSYLTEYSRFYFHDNYIVNLFYSLHYAFAKLHGFNLNKIKIIISHEHSAHFVENYDKYFKKVNYVALIRNPISIYASIKKIFLNREKVLRPIHFDFQFSQILKVTKLIKSKKVYVIKMKK